ncbi:MAG: hypothetical protein GY868_19940, partial [Deltaproteobacteria bacterium]|nr:hypothetical protein [Deltaproteobacteria bacterium]
MLIKLFSWILAPLGIAAYGPVLLSICRPAMLQQQPVQLALCGAAAGSIVWLVFGRRLKLLHVLEHELTHLLFGLLFLKKPLFMTAGFTRGQTGLSGTNCIITLAPYCFPLAAMALLGATLLLPQTSEPYLYVMLGVSLGYYLVSRLGVFREEQPDLKEAGLLF